MAVPESVSLAAQRKVVRRVSVRTSAGLCHTGDNEVSRAKGAEQLLRTIRTAQGETYFALRDGIVAGVEELENENEQLRSAIRWALGYDEGEPEFAPREVGTDQPPYWWRKELRRRAGDI